MRQILPPGAVAQTVTVPASVSPQMLNQIREGTGRAILAASQQEENSYENPKIAHGIFTYRLIEALKLKEGREPIEAVYAYLNSRVTQDAAALGRKQHPVMSRSDQGSSVGIGVMPKTTAFLQ